MSERKYSLSEIDRMREAVRIIAVGPMDWQCNGRGSFIGTSRSGPPYLRVADIEDRLRTYMMNGTDPEELEAAVRDVRARDNENRRQAEERYNGKMRQSAT